MRSSEAGATLRARDGIAGYAGLQHCGSVHACPVDAATILTRRALEIGAVLGSALADGHSLGFGTLTMRHRSTQRLSTLWGAASRAWGRATSGKLWVQVQGRTGLLGWVRVWEVTDGANGWHVHVHFVVVLRAGASRADLDEVCEGMFGRWSRALVREGLDAPRREGQEWHLVGGDDAGDHLAEYLFKLAEQSDSERAKGLGLELAYSEPGRTRQGFKTRPVFSILDDARLDGDADALERWHEWEQGSKGKRQVGWGGGLRARFAPDLEELSDQDLAEQVMGTTDDDLLTITHEGWRALVHIPGVALAVLEATEAGGLEAACSLLDQHQIIYSRNRKGDQ